MLVAEGTTPPLRSVGVKASKNGGVDACFKKTEGKPWEAGAPDASYLDIII
jgi:hypothetical protein